MHGYGALTHSKSTLTLLLPRVSLLVTSETRWQCEFRKQLTAGLYGFAFHQWDWTLVYGGLGTSLWWDV